MIDVVVNNIPECYVKFKRTNPSCLNSKISQSSNMQLISTLFIKVRKLWLFDKAKTVLIEK